MTRQWHCLLLFFFSYNAIANTTNLTQQTETNTTSWWSAIVGCPAPEPRLHIGMWSKHFTPKDRNNQNDLFGIGYKGLFAGTLVNSYYVRAYAIGMERFWFTKQLSVKHDISYQLGYRLGLVTGYQGHDLTGIQSLRDSPVIPFVQAIFDVNWKHLGWEVSIPDPYVISMGFYIRF